MLCFWYWYYFDLTIWLWFGCFGNEYISFGKGSAVVWTHFGCCFMGNTQPNVEKSHTHIHLFVNLKQASVVFWLAVGAFGETFPRTFVRSVVLLVGGASWQVLWDGHGLLCFLGRFVGRGAVPAWRDTHQRTPITHQATPRRVSFRGSKITSGWGKKLFAGLLYLPLWLNHAVGSLLPGIWAISWASSVSMRCKYSNGREMEM